MPGASPGARAGVECWRRTAPALRRLICFPHAGAGAGAYQAWPSAFPEHVQVCALRPPGREQLVACTPFDRMAPLIDWAVARIEPLLDAPFVLFGHSLGAIVAFEVARKLRDRGLPAPEALLVSGRRAPQLPPRDPPVSDLPDDAFIDRVARIQGTPVEAFAHAELRALLLPALRADFAVLEHYEYAPRAPFDFPLHVFGGADDPLVPREDLEAWATHTRDAFDLRTFPGHHFYLQTQREPLLREIQALLGEPARRGTA